MIAGIVGRSHPVNNPQVHTQAEWRVQDGCPCVNTQHVRAVQILQGTPEHCSHVCCVLTCDDQVYQGEGLGKPLWVESGQMSKMTHPCAYLSQFLKGFSKTSRHETKLCSKQWCPQIL